MDDAWLSLVRVARDLGDVSSIFPPGITRIVDLPFTLHNAVLAALSFLSFDELSEEEKPPKRIWTDSSQMARHWEWVKQERQLQAEGKGGMSKPSASNPILDQLKIIVDG